MESTLSGPLQLSPPCLLHDQAADHWRGRNELIHDGIALLQEVKDYYCVSHSYSLINLLIAWETIVQKDKETPLAFSFRIRELVGRAGVAGQTFTDPFICYRFSSWLGPGLQRLCPALPSTSKRYYHHDSGYIDGFCQDLYGYSGF